MTSPPTRVHSQPGLARRSRPAAAASSRIPTTATAMRCGGASPTPIAWPNRPGATSGGTPRPTLTQPSSRTRRSSALPPRFWRSAPPSVGGAGRRPSLLAAECGERDSGHGTSPSTSGESRQGWRPRFAALPQLRHHHAETVGKASSTCRRMPVMPIQHRYLRYGSDVQLQRSGSSGPASFGEWDGNRHRAIAVISVVAQGVDELLLGHGRSAADADLAGPAQQVLLGQCGGGCPEPGAANSRR
jgi:hypothetical protein